jgi:hypothetical protein
MGFAIVTFGFAYDLQAPPEPLRSTREPSLPSPRAFCVPASCTVAYQPIYNCLRAFEECRDVVRNIAPRFICGEEVRDVVSRCLRQRIAEGAARFGSVPGIETPTLGFGHFGELRRRHDQESLAF